MQPFAAVFEIQITAKSLIKKSGLPRDLTYDSRVIGEVHNKLSYEALYSGLAMMKHVQLTIQE